MRINGTNGNDILLGTSRRDRITGAAGDDWILAGRGDDTADGGAGSDRLLMGLGNDTAIYKMSENLGAHDVYDGGGGRDTLSLELTRAQWLSSAVQSDIARFLDALNRGGGFGCRDFDFSAFDLTARSFEALRVTVDGVEVSAKDDRVHARDDRATVAADKTVTLDVLRNDRVPDLVKKVEQVSGPGVGALSLNADGTFTFDTKGAFDSLGAGQTATVVFTYRVTDADGDSDTARVTITVTGIGGGGANQPPVVTGAIAIGSATEIVDQAADENTATHTATGTVSFTDANLGDSHTVSVTANGANYRGTLTANVSDVATGDGAGVVTWNYSVGDAALDGLAAGQTLTQSYTVTINDGHGGSATQIVTLTIVGSNDAPTITSAVQAGAVTEVADGAAGENDTTHVASGAVTFTDVDLIDTLSASVQTQGGGYLGTFSLNPVDQVGDSVGWSLSVADAALDRLAAGQVLTQSYLVTVDDGHGGTASQTVTITITGGNDAPIITSAAQAGSVTEIADGTAGENGTALTATGAVTFADVDLIDTHSASFAEQGGGYLGAFSLDPVNQAGDTVGWNFSVADADLDGLAAGETLTQSYVVTVDDGQGGTATQTVTITIEGSNDVPTITSAVQAGSVTEIADGAAGESATTHTASGAITFADVDLTDTHGLSFEAQGASYLGAFVLDPVNQSGDSVGWIFSVADDALDGLAAGQTLTQSYVVTVSDGQGGTATQTVTIMVEGSNDAPSITSAVQAGTVTEIVDGAGGENAATLTATGAITFADVDLTDTHGVSFVAQGGGYLGTFALDPVNQAGDAVGWTFSVADGALDGLAAGETLTQSYVVTVDDGQGGTATQTVAITIEGSNDVPTITSAVQAGSVTEITDGVAGENATNHTASGAVTFADVDLTDTHGVSVAAQGANYLGAFVLDPVNQAGGSVAWSFSVADVALDGLAAGQTLTQSYVVTVDDGNGGTATQTVTITIDGANDAPTITSAAQAGAVTEITDGVAGENATTLTASGAVNFADVDVIDTHGASFAAQGAGYLGAFALDPVDQAGDAVGWTFSVADDVLDDLAAGETLTQSYVVTVDDGHGGTATQAITITINGTNDAPTITSAVQSAVVTEIADGAPGENTTTHTASGAVSFADVDRTDTHLVSFAARGGGYLGAFSLDPLDQAGGSVGWTFSLADAELDGLRADQSLTQSYLVTFDDGQGGTVDETVTVTIQGTNDAPVAVADVAAGGQGEVLTVDVVANDTDVDLGDTRTLLGGDVPAGKGALSVLDNKLVFDPGTSFLHLAQGASEVVTATYAMRDGAGALAGSTLEITVTGINDAPVAVADTALGGQTGVLTIDVLANDSDVDDGHTLTLVSASVPLFSGLVSVLDNQIVFDPGDDFLGIGAGEQRVVVVDYTIQDEHGATASSTLTITLTGANNAPIAEDVSAVGFEDGPIFVPSTPVFDNDAGDTLTFSFVPDGIHHGTLVSNGGGSFTYTPDADFSGEDSFIYIATDSHGAVGSGTLFFTVNAVADVPDLSVGDGAVSGNAGSPIALDIAAALTDTDGSEILGLEVSGVPDGWTLSAGVFDSASGTWLVPGDGIAGLSVTAPSGVDGDATLLVKAVATEQSDGATAQSGVQSISVVVASDAMFATNPPMVDMLKNPDAPIVPQDGPLLPSPLNDPPHTMDFIL